MFSSTSPLPLSSIPFDLCSMGSTSLRTSRSGAPILPKTGTFTFDPWLTTLKGPTVQDPTLCPPLLRMAASRLNVRTLAAGLLTRTIRDASSS